MAVRGGVGHGKSGAPLARGCFLLLLLLLLLLVDEAHALTTPHHPEHPLANSSVRFRGGRSALMHPTAIIFSPPSKEPAKQQQPVRHLGSSSSSFLPPGVVSHAPSTGAQLDPYSRSVPSLATPAITPAPDVPQPHNWASGGGSYLPQPTVTTFGLDRGTPWRPAKWLRPRTSPTFMEGVGGWAGMNAPEGQDEWLSHPRTHHTPDMPDSDSPFSRHDTFGLEITEDLSHLNDKPSGWRQKVTEGEFPVGGRGSAEHRGRGTVFKGGARQTHLWPIEKEVEDEEKVDDFNVTAEYQPDDYNAYHEYDHSNTSPVHDQGILTFKHVMEIHNLASQADLHALLDQRGITFDELRAFLNNGAQKKDVLEFLKAPTPSTPTFTTTTSPPVLSYPPSAFDVSVVDEGYQDDVSRQGPLPPSKTEGVDDDTDREDKEQSRKSRKKGRRGKGGRKKNRRRKEKKRQRGGASDVTVSPSPQLSTTEAPGPDPWIPTTERTLPEITSSTTAATRKILMPITLPSTPDTLTTSPSSVRTSDVFIQSVTLVEAPTDPQPETPGQTTFVEEATPPRKKTTHSSTNPWEERNPRKIPRPVRPSPDPEQTINEIEKVNFVREKQRDDYVFPLRGLLIISGLMGALAVFTLVVLISYAVIKCSKKPVVNNYQVSEQQKATAT